MSIFTFLLSYLGGLVLSIIWLSWQRCRNSVALPNHRSSHQTPTPQGGGVSIAVVGIVVLWFLSADVSKLDRLWLISPFIVVTVAGWLDDFHNLSGRWKLVLISGAVVLLLCESLPATVVVSGFSTTFSLDFRLIAPILLLGLVWVVNLTNFMDGIDGSAVLEVMFLLLATWLFRRQLALSSSDTVFIICIGLACLAFLPFNFPTAYLFLGDTGSLFLGLFVAWLLILFFTAHPNGLWAFLTLFAMFWVDATLTLWRRLRRGKSIFEAHREHAYQYLANIVWKSHIKTTLFILLVNVLWLLPMASIVLQSTHPMVWCATALLPVVVIYVKSTGR